MRRRTFLSIAGFAAAAGIGGMAITRFPGKNAMAQGPAPFKPYPFDPVTTSNFRQPLFIPSDSGPFGVLDVAESMTIKTRAATFPLLDGKPSPFLLYETTHAGKAYQNPIFRIQAGQRMRAKLQNGLSEPTIIHWHGLHNSAVMDGHPASTVAAGGEYAYDFQVNNRGGTYWYHTHAHELTAEQAYGGLASFFLVEDEDQQRLAAALDLKFGETDVPLVIQDKQFDEAGRMRYTPGQHDRMAGWLGDVILTNLTPNAVLQVTPRHYRFRLLNGSNSRIYRIAFAKQEQQLDFHVIGSDGGLLDKPHATKEVFLAPGERIDVVFDAAQAMPGDAVFIRSLAFDPMGGGMGGGMMGGMMGRMMASMSSSRLALGEPFNIMKLDVVAGERGHGRLPERLSELPPIDTGKAQERAINIDLQQMQFTINGDTYHADKVPVTVRKGATEIWRIRGADHGVPHPMHIHGFSFQVLSRSNSPKQVAALAVDSQGRSVSDLGWKDTVLVWPGEVVRIALDFSHDYPGDQTYVFHCHNLEHEDMGMMINYRVMA